MEYFKVTGTYEYTQSSKEIDIESVVVRKTIYRIVRAFSPDKVLNDMLCEHETWVDGPFVNNATLADIELEELRKWNASAPLSNFQLAVARGDMAAE